MSSSSTMTARRPLRATAETWMRPAPAATAFASRFRSTRRRAATGIGSSPVTVVMTSAGMSLRSSTAHRTQSAPCAAPPSARSARVASRIESTMSSARVTAWRASSPGRTRVEPRGRIRGGAPVRPGSEWTQRPDIAGLAAALQVASFTRSHITSGKGLHRYTSPADACFRAASNKRARTRWLAHKHVAPRGHTTGPDPGLPRGRSPQISARVTTSAHWRRRRRAKERTQLGFSQGEPGQS
jgi:hypothetical protein